MAAFLNVRLGEEEKRSVEELKASGVEVSTVVRRALREEAEKLRKQHKRMPTAAALVAEMLAAWPDEGGRVGPHPLDRIAFARAFAGSLKAKTKTRKAKGRG